MLNDRQKNKIKSIIEERDFWISLYEANNFKRALVLPLVRYFTNENKIIPIIDDLLDCELEKNHDPKVLFRGNSVTTKVIDYYLSTAGSDYLKEMIQPFIDKVCKTAVSFEINPQLCSQSNLDENKKQLEVFGMELITKIYKCANSMPDSLKKLFYLIRTKIESHYCTSQYSHISVTCFLFLRFFCPAILNPQLHSLRIKASLNRYCFRNLTVLAKVLQNIANGVCFGEKELYMVVMNNFVATCIPKILAFVRKVSSVDHLINMTSTKLDIDCTLELSLFVSHLLQNVNEASFNKDLDEFLENMT
ncbi:Ras GTPase-activating protein domain-containing protein [Rozella allomycis CSF55]|uniref:Ras GTPase-activating protein domain-containing protein n=1 Tax=Rozella allomycis (strain CSF55) TaxID=988480 RepID=A0A075AUU2_ROZAC|nr:Ras GTPase-activating protein domain-containing protein [Rozella allomycis CSF55]|eukprot:EPZ34023.1 Ras GTPase-activating protein domain-containing protein [Rozella allomycis CSF55]